MSNTNGIEQLPAMYLGLTCNNDSEYAAVEYFDSLAEGEAWFNDKQKEYERVFLYQLVRAAEVEK